MENIKPVITLVNKSKSVKQQKTKSHEKHPIICNHSYLQLTT